MDKPAPDRPMRPRRATRPRQDPEADVVPSGPASVPRPVVPDVPTGSLPRGIRRSIEQQVRDPDRASEVQRAVVAGGRLLDTGDGDEARPLLAWAKMHAPRSPEIREALGVAHYQAGDYRAAVKELRTYRRMSGARDQDHLIADCLRGLGRPVADVAAMVEPLVASDGVPPERQVEGLLVWAGALRDARDVAGARAVLRRADRDLLRRAGPDARARHTWLSADLAELAGDLDVARQGFEELRGLPDDPFDAGARVATLS